MTQTGFLKAGEYGFETMLAARKMARTLKKTLPQLRLEHADLAHLAGSFANPKALYQGILAVYEVKLSQAQCTRLWYFIEHGQIDAQTELTRGHKRNLLEILSAIRPEFRQPKRRKVFVHQLQEYQLIHAHHLQLRPLSRFRTPQDLQTAVYDAFHIDLSLEKAQALTHFIQTGTHDGKQVPTRLEFNKYKRWLGQIQPEYAQDFSQFAQDLVQKQTQSVQIQVQADLAPLKSKFANPRALFESIQHNLNVQLSRPKAEALYQLIETGCLDGQQDPQGEAIFKIKQIIQDLNSNFFDAALAHGEGKYEYGDITRQYLQILAGKLNTNQAGGQSDG